MCHWLEVITGNCGLRTNIVMDFRAQQLGPLVNYTLTERNGLEKLATLTQLSLLRIRPALLTAVFCIVPVKISFIKEVLKIHQ